MAIFGGFLDSFNCNVTGEEDHIQPFEKYCICCMVTWQGFCQETIGYLMTATDPPSSISRYETEWMPLLSAVGANVSKLDLVIMNHSYFDIYHCKEHGLIYVENGVAYKNEVLYNYNKNNE
jgi:hypothetical protein